MTTNISQDKIHKLATIAVADIKRLHSKLNEFQEMCTHSESEIILLDGFLKKSCLCCYKIIGYPTKDELLNAGYRV
jgi:hypothetical protein